jgi:hypothetical protein
MNGNDYERQIEQARQQAAGAGFSGTAIVDVHLAKGFLRQKVEVNPPEKLAEFMTNYVNILVMVLAMMNIQAKVNIAKD